MKSITSIFVIVLLLPHVALIAQEKERIPRCSKEIFESVQNSLAWGAADELTSHFGKHIYLSIRSESGYYSVNQARFVLQNFFNNNKPLSFSFTTYGEAGGLPYATGRGSLNVRGNREYIQVYVSLVKEKDKWVISQLNIY